MGCGAAELVDVPDQQSGRFLHCGFADLLAHLPNQIGTDFRVKGELLITHGPAQFRQQQIRLRHPRHFAAQEMVAQIVEQFRGQDQRQGGVIGELAVRFAELTGKPGNFFLGDFG